MIILKGIEDSTLASVIYQYDDEVAKGMAYQLIGSAEEKHFAYGHNNKIYRAIKTTLDMKQVIDLAHIDQHTPEEAKEHLYGLGECSTTKDISKMIIELKTAYKGRQMKEMFHRSIQKLGNASDLCQIPEIEREMMELIIEGAERCRDESTIGEYMSEWFEETQNMMKADSVKGIPTGLPQIDSLLGGLKGGETIVVAGRPGMGKSSLVATMMSHQIINGYKPALFSFELSRKEIMDKYFSIISDMDSETKKVSFQKINNPSGGFRGIKLNQFDLETLGKLSSKYFFKNESYIRGTSKTTIEDIIARCRQLKANNNLDALYLDHIGLLVHDKNKERQELSHITNSLKLFAGEMNIPVIEVCQLGRGADDANSEPKLSDLKGSGTIEEDANVVLFPWRPYAINREGNESDSKIIIAKSRNSGTGSIKSHFCTETTRFTEVDEKHEEQEEQNNNTSPVCNETGYF